MSNRDKANIDNNMINRPELLSKSEVKALRQNLRDSYIFFAKYDKDTKDKDTK